MDFRVNWVDFPAIAAADGVERIQYDRWGFVITAAHPRFGYWTSYVHLQTAEVTQGEPVRRGQTPRRGRSVYLLEVVHVHLKLCTNATCWDEVDDLAGTV